jgi:Limiting CO2-inducible proteins B/C beta carbonyic anhydrases
MPLPLIGKMFAPPVPVPTGIEPDDVILEISPELVQLFFFVFCAWGMVILFELDVIRRKIVGGFNFSDAGSVLPPAEEANGWVTGAAVTTKSESSTPANPVTVSKIMSVYPRAITNSDLVNRVTSALEKYGYGSTTLMATSLCCDEVNRQLDRDFGKIYGEHFSMGGLAGFAFGGVTSFGAMAHHIPTGGDCLVVYGPHVGVDSDGNVGKINRRGRKSSGACCGSGVAAAGYVDAVRKGKRDAAAPATNALDAQQTFVGNMLLPHGQRLEEAADTMAELPLAMFDAQNELMQQIVAAGCGEVGGDGKIALLGGVQINTPDGTPDYFLPQCFEIRDNHGRLIQNLLW